jgi:PAS domain S-box-containing protein
MPTEFREAIFSINNILDNAVGCRRNELEQLWFDRLRTEWGPVSELKFSILQQANPAGLLDVALKALAGQEEISRRDVAGFIQRVRCLNYSISDLYTEFICLDDALGKFLPTMGIRNHDVSLLMERFRKSFCSLFGMVLSQTSEFYEHVVEQSKTGFCQTDEDGRIVYVNQETKRILGDCEMIGKPLKSFFEGYESDLVQQALSQDTTTAPAIQRLNIRSSSGKRVPVGVELARVLIGGKSVGGYAHLTDISRPVKLQNEVFDRLMLGIIRVNSERKVTFMNKNLREMLDITGDDWQCRPIDDLLPDTENKKKIHRKLHDRFDKGVSDEYEARFLRRDKRSIPVKITAAPEKTHTGKVIRTIAVIRSMVQERMHEHIEREREPQKLLQAVMEEMLSAIPFDRAYVVLYSQDEKHVRSFFRYSSVGKPVIDQRWWEIKPDMLEWIKKKRIIPVPNIKKFYGRPAFKHLKSEPSVQEILKNFSSFIYYPVSHGNRIVACAVFYSKDPGRYGKKDISILRDLPLASAVLMAIHYEEKKNLEFLLNLSKEISRAGDDMQKIADVLVNSIASHYGWQNVALFSARKTQRIFHLLSQHTSEDFRIPSDFTQPIDKGILGYVYGSGKPVNVGNVQEEYRNIYEPTVKKTRSELCIPIESGELFWLLNIEDPRKNAFSKDEEMGLVRLVDEVRVFLERSWLRIFLDRCLLSTSDAVWVTDDQGKISQTNPAARRLLKLSEEDLAGRDLADIFRDREIAKGLIEATKMPNVKIGLIDRDGNFVNVLLSKFRLQEHFGTNVYVAKDLSAQERLEELQYLGKMYFEIATQTQTPLTLIFGWLERLGRNTKDETVREILDRSMRQLRRIELSYNRLSLYDKNRISEPAFPYNEVLCNINEIWKIVEEDFPQNELKRIERNPDGGDRFILGDLFQLSFCFETILSYMIRFLPEDQKIQVQVSASENKIEVKFVGIFPGLKTESDGDGFRGKIARTLFEMALGEEIITEFINKHRGNYSGAKWTGDRIEFSITLPPAEEYAK